jgi:hypothetical protein
VRVAVGMAAVAAAQVATEHLLVLLVVVVAQNLQ